MAYRIESRQIQSATDTPVAIKLQFNSAKLFTPSFTTNEQAISNLKNLLLTRKGERFLQPNFGTDLLYLIFEPNTDDLVEQIQTTIFEAVSFWLPYITLEQIQVVTNEQDPTLIHQVRVIINFTVTTTGSEQKITIIANENGNFEVLEA